VGNVRWGSVGGNGKHEGMAGTGEKEGDKKNAGKGRAGKGNGGVTSFSGEGDKLLYVRYLISNVMSLLVCLNTSSYKSSTISSGSGQQNAEFLSSLPPSALQSFPVSLLQSVKVPLPGNEVKSCCNAVLSIPGLLFIFHI
jgi:hypothetical protein